MRKIFELEEDIEKFLFWGDDPKWGDTMTLPKVFENYYYQKMYQFLGFENCIYIKCAKKSIYIHFDQFSDSVHTLKSPFYYYHYLSSFGPILFPKVSMT